MSATIRNDQGVAIASLAGEVRGEDALAELFELVTGPSARIVLDMSGVSFLSSAGIGDLVQIGRAHV